MTPEQPSMPVTPGTPTKFPTWAKVIIGMVVAFFVFAILGGIGMMFLARSVMHKIANGENNGVQQLIEKGIEKQIEKATGEKTDIHLSANGLEVRDEKGEQKFTVGTGATLPADFPKDIPVYQPSTVVSSINMGGTMMINLETPSKPDQVSDFYKAQLPANGWTSSMNMATDQQGQMFFYVKGEHSLTITLSAIEGGKTGFMVSYGGEGPKPVED